jgi:hypothetical protein
VNQPTAYEAARAEALPYAKAIVAAQEHPAYFNQADIWHAVGLQVSAIASIAVTQGRSVHDVASRAFPGLFQIERAAVSLEEAA